jgi:hypothetical protein
MVNVRIDSRHAARVLAATSWRRDYEKDPKLRHEAYQAEITTLVGALKQELGSLIGLLYDNHAINWGDGNSILLYEGEKKEQIVSCHLNVSNVGTIGVQYFPRIGTESSEDFQMIRNGKFEYGWLYRGQSLSSTELAELIVQHILEIGNQVVGHSVRENPKLPASEETS